MPQHLENGKGPLSGSNSTNLPPLSVITGKFQPLFRECGADSLAFHSAFSLRVALRPLILPVRDLLQPRSVRFGVSAAAEGERTHEPPSIATAVPQSVRSDTLAASSIVLKVPPASACEPAGTAYPGNHPYQRKSPLCGQLSSPAYRKLAD